jgi:hypothetical protein
LSGFRRFVLAGAIIAAAAGVTKLSAQSVLSDPKDAPKVFASTCSACHKSPQGLAKSGQVAGFLRQHYTTGAEMSAAMAAYLVAAGSGPAGKKGAPPATVTPSDEGDARAKAKEAAKEARAKAKEAREAKAKKQEQLAAAHPAGERPGAAAAETQKQKQTLRGKQRPANSQQPETAAPVTPAEAPVTNPIAKPAEPPAEEQKQTAAAAAQPVAAAAAGQQSAPQQSAAGAVTTATSGEVELNIPPPPMPEAAPPELSQSAFSSSPLP